MKIGGGLGLVVGLLSPPLLASVVIGGAAGDLVGRSAKHKVESGPGEKMGAALPSGSAGIPRRSLAGNPLSRPGILPPAQLGPPDSTAPHCWPAHQTAPPYDYRRSPSCHPPTGSGARPPALMYHGRARC